MLLIIFFIAGVCPFWGFEVQAFWFRVLSTTPCIPCVLFRAYGAAARKSGPRRGRTAVPGGGFTGRAAEGRACCFARSCRVADGGAPSGSGGLAGRRMEGPAAVLDGGGGVSGGMAGLAVSDGRVGQLSRRTADGPGGRGRPPLPHACRWSVPVPVSVSVPSRKSDVRRGKTAPKLVFARTKAYL